MGDPSTVVQTLYAAFGRGDVAAVLELLSDDSHWQFIGDRQAGYAGQARGKAAVAEWFAKVARADDIQAFEPREFLTGTDHVTVLGWERTIARSSGSEFESDWVHVFTLRDGKVCRFVGTLDSEASAAAR
jgi:ketosteroid isomerase-like protein